MADLLDIAPSTSVDVVKVRGLRITVTGLRANGIASIVARFPQLASLLGGSAADIGAKLIEQFGNAVGPIIAAGCGHLGDEEYERVGNSLLLEEQAQFLAAIIGLTFPNGLTSFVATVKTMLPDEGGKKVHMVRLKKSPLQSPSSSDVASRQTMQ